MIEITQKLSRSVKLEEVLPNVLEGLFEIFIQADRGFIIIKNEKGDLIPICSKARRPDQEDTLRMSKTIMKHVMEERQAVISLDATNDERFNQSQSVFDLRLRSIIVAPLLIAKVYHWEQFISIQFNNVESSNVKILNC